MRNGLHVQLLSVSCGSRIYIKHPNNPAKHSWTACKPGLKAVELVAFVDRNTAECSPTERAIQSVFNMPVDTREGVKLKVIECMLNFGRADVATPYYIKNLMARIKNKIVDLVSRLLSSVCSHVNCHPIIRLAQKLRARNGTHWNLFSRISSIYPEPGGQICWLLDHKKVWSIRHSWRRWHSHRFSYNWLV